MLWGLREAIRLPILEGRMNENVTKRRESGAFLRAQNSAEGRGTKVIRRFALGGCAAALAASAALAAARAEPEAVSTDAATGDPACQGAAPRIAVTVTNIQQQSGVIVADLHDGVPENFLKKGHKIARVRMPADGSTAQFCFSDLAPGTYGLGVYHDVNDNGDFDQNFVGLPAEPWGLSTNPGFKPRAPRLSDADFEVGEGQTELTVRLK